MIIECPSCAARYQYDEERFERKPSKKIKCAKCQQIFEIRNPAFAATTPKADLGESTSMRRAKKPEVKPTETTEQSPIPQSGSSDVLRMPVGKRLSLAIIDGP
ncbi:MAG TPA: zinc-ribbon domain-containing protein, partial [Thermoanaerobaculia bacterium]